MKASDLITTLEKTPDADVPLHDEATGDELPVGRVEVTDDGVVLHAEGC